MDTALQEAAEATQAMLDEEQRAWGDARARTRSEAEAGAVAGVEAGAEAGAGTRVGAGAVLSSTERLRVRRISSRDIADFSWAIGRLVQAHGPTRVDR